MKTSQKGKIALVVSEGIVETPYLDSVGVWTVGVGVTKSAGDIDPEKNKGKIFTIPQIMAMFEKVLPRYESIIDRNVKVSLAQNEYDALVHFVYNVGEPNFKRSKLLRLLNEGKKKEAFQTGFHGWLKPASLIGRRDKERAIALNSNYGGSTTTLFTVNKSYKPVKKGTVDVAKALQTSGATVTPKPPATVNEVVKPVVTETTKKVTEVVPNKPWWMGLITAILSAFKKK